MNCKKIILFVSKKYLYAIKYYIDTKEISK